MRLCLQSNSRSPKDRRRYSSCHSRTTASTGVSEVRQSGRSTSSSSRWATRVNQARLRFRTFPTSSTEAIHSASNLRLETMSSMCVSQVVLTTQSDANDAVVLVGATRQGHRPGEGMPFSNVPRKLFANVYLCSQSGMV